MPQWNDQMKNVGATPALEDATREAVLKAYDYLAAIPAGGKRPSWNGGRVLIPSNDEAVAMNAAITAHLDDSVAGLARATIVTTAVTAAQYAFSRGRTGDAAWQALVEKLKK